MEWCRPMMDTAISIVGVAEPSGHSRDGHFPAEQTCGFDPPWYRLEKRLCDSGPIEVTDAVVDQDGMAIIGQEVTFLHQITSDPPPDSAMPSGATAFREFRAMETLPSRLGRPTRSLRKSLSRLQSACGF